MKNTFKGKKLQKLNNKQYNKYNKSDIETKQMYKNNYRDRADSQSS